MMFDSIPHWFSSAHGERAQAVRPLHHAADAVRAQRRRGGRAGRQHSRRGGGARRRSCRPAAASSRSTAWPPLDRIGLFRAHPAEHDAAGVRPMTRYAAFLRGVNVGGVNLKMAEVPRRSRTPDSPTCGRYWPAATCCSTVGQGRRGRARRPRRRCVMHSVTTPGCWPTTSTRSQRSRRSIRSSARSRATTPTSHSSPTRRCSTSSPTLAKDAGADEKIKRGDGRHLLAGAQDGDAGHHHRQDDGQEALQVVDHHP